MVPLAIELQTYCPGCDCILEKHSKLIHSNFKSSKKKRIVSNQNQQGFKYVILSLGNIIIQFLTQKSLK